MRHLSWWCLYKFNYVLQRGTIELLTSERVDYVYMGCRALSPSKTCGSGPALQEHSVRFSLRLLQWARVHVLLSHQVGQSIVGLRSNESVCYWSRRGLSGRAWGRPCQTPGHGVASLSLLFGVYFEVGVIILPGWRQRW